LATALAAGALLVTPIGVMAQAFPSRVVSLVVPFPAGSTTDNVARKMAEYLRAKTGASVIVDNKVGADGNLAAQFVLRAPADGYTMFVTGNSVHGANANLFKEMPFDPINDFDMIGGVMTIPMVLAVRSDFPAGNVQEFVAESKRRQTPLFYATGNNSTRGASELFKVRYGLKVDHVPYRGSPQVLADLIGGQFDFAFIDVNTVSPALKDGRLKGLAITSEKRLPALQDVPTVAESLPGFQFGAWVGVVVRGKTPPDVEARLASLVHDFATDPATVAYLGSIGSAPMPMSPKELRSFVEAETRTWAEIVKAANIEKK
jgi:tripartite-type tricarboxylate transporter receptor subunit TctC